MPVNPSASATCSRRSASGKRPSRTTSRCCARRGWSMSSAGASGRITRLPPMRARGYVPCSP